MDKEQIKAISESIPMEQRFSVEQIVSAAIESYKAELLNEAGERIAALEIYEHLAAEYGLSVFEDMAKLKDQLAKAEQQAKILRDLVEQEVAEACALQVATETKFHWLDAARVAKEIRSGEWRKFVKKV